MDDAIKKPTVLVVDDTPNNLTLMRGLLAGNYSVKIANGGEAALRIAIAEVPPDLILLDIMMPHVDGYEVCRRLKSDTRTRDIPVIFLTAMSEVEDERKGFDLGAVDYITKPISPPIVLARVKTHLHLKAAQDFLKDKNAYLEQEVARRTREVQAIQDVTIVSLASLAETRDDDTGNHIRRTQYYVKALAEQLKPHPRFAPVLDDAMIKMLFKCAPLHDIGKVGIPDSILNKPGKLDPDEFAIMQRHTILGRQSLENAERRFSAEIEFFKVGKAVAYSHHEKWNGAGYPEGIGGDSIPVCARIMAVADVFDALMCRRVYRAPMPADKAVAIIREGIGSHFDPDVGAAFVAISDQLCDVAQSLAD
jgi:putative two-component system response regulator